jgi:hypothetical protein
MTQSDSFYTNSLGVKIRISRIGGSSWVAGVETKPGIYLDPFAIKGLGPFRSKSECACELRKIYGEIYIVTRSAIKVRTHDVLDYLVNRALLEYPSIKDRHYSVKKLVVAMTKVLSEMESEKKSELFKRMSFF